MGRPLIEIDEQQVENLAAIGCTQVEIGAVVGCSVDTLHRRFADVIKRGNERMKASLRRWQYERAKGGSVAMLIWLGKNYLEQTDVLRQETTGKDGGPIELAGGWEKERAAIVEALAAHPEAKRLLIDKLNGRLGTTN